MYNITIGGYGVTAAYIHTIFSSMLSRFGVGRQLLLVSPGDEQGSVMNTFQKVVVLTRTHQIYKLLIHLQPLLPYFL
jgi:hypothetical protein